MVVMIHSPNFRYLAGLARESYRLAILSVILAPFLQSANASPVFLSPFEAEHIKSLVAQNQQPWTNAYNVAISQANNALNTPNQSVTFQGNSSHEYYTQNPYDWSNNLPSPCGSNWCDGQLNPLADRGDYTAVTTVSHAVQRLGVGYALTGNYNYAEKAVELINVWCVDSTTFMNPNIKPAAAIEQYITLSGLLYGANLIWDFPGWNSAERSEFADWTEQLIASIIPSPTGHNNNWESWRQVLVASGGALLDNPVFLNEAFNKWKALLPKQIGADGTMRLELDRTISFHYSTYALCAMTLVAEIARHQGIDLYSYTVNGRNLELAWDYHAPYILNPSTWSAGQQIKAYNYEGVALYELAYTHLGKQPYLNVINNRGRPMQETRVLGPATLTHSFRIDVPPPSSNRVETPHFSPDGGSSIDPVSVSLSSATAGATIYYTLDGSDPTTSSVIYSGPFVVSTTTTVKAFAAKTGLDDSFFTSATLTIGELNSSSHAWQNDTIDTQFERVAVAFDLSPSAAPINGVTGLSAGPASKYSDLAVNIRFSPEGFVDARNGSNYEAETTLEYEPNATYHFQLNIDLAAKRYSATVDVDGSTYLIAENYAFRAEQSNVNSLTNLAIYASAGSHILKNPSFSQWVAEPTPLPPSDLQVSTTEE